MPDRCWTIASISQRCTTSGDHVEQHLHSLDWWTHRHTDQAHRSWTDRSSYFDRRHEIFNSCGHYLQPALQFPSWNVYLYIYIYLCICNPVGVWHSITILQMANVVHNLKHILRSSFRLWTYTWVRAPASTWAMCGISQNFWCCHWVWSQCPSNGCFLHSDLERNKIQ